MLREKNIEERDQFFKMIDQDIKRMSGMDLSKQQNVDAASSIFNQVLDNQSIVKDMVWTKNWQKEHQRADGFRNCVDPEKCGGAWWQGGVDYLNYQAEEFKNATDEEAMAFGNARYTPYQDVMGKAIKLAKEADLSIKVDQKSGGYIVTTKNGPNLVKPLASLFMGTLGKDPAVMEYFKTKAYVDRKNWINSNIPVYGSEEAATNAFIQNAMHEAGPKLKKTLESLGYAQENVSNQRKALEDEIRTNGTLANSSMADIYRQMVGTEQQLAESMDVVKDANGNLQVGLNNASTKAALSHLDNALAGSYLQDEIGQAAQTLAWKDYEQTMEADPYALENVRQSNRIALERIKYKKELGVAKYKFDLEQQAKKEEARGGVMHNEGIAVDVVGGVGPNLEPDAAYRQWEEDVKSAEDNVSLTERQMLTEAFATMQLQAKNSDPAKAAAAKADLISMAEAFVTSSGNESLINRFNKMSPEAKLKFIEKANMADKLNALPGSTLDDMYTNVLHPMMDMTNPSNRVTRKYLNKLWSSQENVSRRDRIKAKQTVLDQLDAGHREQVAKVKADIQSQDSEVPTEIAQALNVFIDENGNSKSRDQFVKDYVDQVMANTPDRMYVSWGGSQQPTNEPMIDAFGGLFPVKKDEAGNEITEPTDFAAIRADAIETAKEMYDNMDEDDNLMQRWREAYSTYAVAKGQKGATHGGGSLAVEKGIMYQADPVHYSSVATMGFNGFAQDVFAAGPDQARVAIGASGAIPEESSETAEAILRQLYADMTTRGNPKDQDRPILQVTYQDIAGGNSDWTAVNIKVDDAYASQYTGSKANKGLLYENRLALQGDGLTMYLKKDAASNQFYENSKYSDIDTVIHYNGEYEITDFPEEFNGTLSKMDNGYMLQGTLFDIDENGNPSEESFTQPYWGQDVNPNWIMEDFRGQFLNGAVKGLRKDKARYNATNGIKDPQAL
jgi:hypothetical protein